LIASKSPEKSAQRREITTTTTTTTTKTTTTTTTATTTTTIAITTTTVENGGEKISRKQENKRVVLVCGELDVGGGTGQQGLKGQETLAVDLGAVVRERPQQGRHQPQLHHRPLQWRTRLG
jgi:hypothetical protein